MTKLTGNRVNVLRLLAGALTAAALASTGCSSGPAGSGVDLPDRPDLAAATPPAANDPCAFPALGCACAAGQATECGEVLSREEGSVTCAIGTRRCDNNAWGSCSRENVITRQLPANGSAYSTMGLGAPAQCANNPCDPYCYNIIDNGSGLDAGSPLKIADGGVTLDGKPKPPPKQYNGLEVAPNNNPTLITVTAIPPGQYPVTNPSNPIQFKADYLPATNPPAYTPAIWSLDAYDYSLINGAGKLTVITAVPHRPLVKATASSFTATSQAEVIVDVTETDPGIPQAIIDQFNQAAPPPAGPQVVTTTMWSEPFANNSKGWTLDTNPPPPPPPDVPPPPPPDALLKVQTAPEPVVQPAADAIAAPYPGAKTAPQPGDLKAAPPEAKIDTHIAPPLPQGGTTQFQPGPMEVPAQAASEQPLTPLELAARSHEELRLSGQGASSVGQPASIGGPGQPSPAAPVPQAPASLSVAEPPAGGVDVPPPPPPPGQEPPPPPPPCAASYDAAKTFLDRLGSTSMTLAFDGSYYYSSSGGSPWGARYARYDSNGNLVGTYAPGLDFRSVFTHGGNTSPVFARQYASPTIYQQGGIGSFGWSVNLSGGPLDAQSAVIFNGANTEFNAFINGTLTRWNLSGGWLGTVGFAGWGSQGTEAWYPQNRGIAAVGNYYLTYADQNLSVWSTSGTRLSTTKLNGAGTSFDSYFSLSYANGLVWVVDGASGSWRGYDLSACLGNAQAGGTCTHPLFDGAPVNFNCPTGAKSFSYTGALNPGSSDQAKAACEACYGVGHCYLEYADCAGPGWGPSPPGQYQCGNAYFGYQNGCSGDWGRSWPICWSWAAQGYGHWGLPASDSVCSAGGGGTCKATSVTFTIEEAACGGGTFDLWINGQMVRAVAPAVGCMCNSSPMVVTINDPASMALVTGTGDKYGVTVANGSSMAYAYVSVTTTFSNAPTVSFCLFGANGGGCSPRDLCSGSMYQWDVNPSGTEPSAQCTGGGCTHPLFSNGGGYACPTGATSFSFSGALDPSNSDQAKAACEACYGVGKCYLEGADCAGLGWGPSPPGQYICGKAYFGYQNGCSGDNGRSWAICNSFNTYGWWGKPPNAAVCSGNAPEWQIGAPKASSGESYGNPDPASDHGGNGGVAGVVLGGDASQSPHGMAYLTSPAINTSGFTTANLTFWRWLNSDAAPYMVNTVDAYNGAAWTNLWTSGGAPGVADAGWTPVNYDITAFKSASFKFRFGFKVGSNAVAKVSSWNLDDIALTNTTIQPPPPPDTRILYPYANTVFPRSFTPPVLQWDSPTGKNAQYVKYCLRFDDPAWPDPPNRQTFSWCYVQAEQNPKRGSFPLRAWQLFETTASGKDAKLTLQRIYNGAQLAEVDVPIHFSSQPMRGSVYYWQINTGMINRINEDGSLSQNFLATGGHCSACHSVSADGTRLVAQMDGGNGSGAAFLTSNGAMTFWRSQMVQFQAISPNGSWTLWGENPLYLSPTNSPAINNWFYSAQGGRVVANPAWSPLGNYVAYASRINAGWYVDFYNADLGLIQVNPATGGFGANKIIIPAPGGNRPIVTYPNFTPDDKYIVYQTASAIRTRGNYGDLWIADVNGNGRTELKNAEGAYLQASDQDVSYEPTFSPTASGGYYWLVFVSNRSYGNTILPAPPQKDNGIKQLWVTAIDQNPQLGTDPSHPAFWLAGQQTNNNNMRGAFAKSPCKPNNALCSWNDDCCGYNAQNPAASTAKCVISQPVSLPITRTCTQFVPGQCNADGKACAVDTDCCNYPTSSCIQGLCQVPSFTQYASGTFVRDFDPACGPGTHVQWTLYNWKAYTPGDSDIVFQAQTADTIATLNAAPLVSLVTAVNQNGTWAFVDVGSKIGLSKNYLRITATLNPSSDATLAPALTDWTMQYDCLPSQ